jgi:pyrroline-5-carboxylate reductase
MGSAILSGVLESCAKSKAAGEKPRIAHFIATVQSQGSAQGLKTRFAKYGDVLEVLQADNVSAMRKADIVMLACKPYLANTVLKADGVRAALAGKLVISVLVGSPVAKLEAAIYHAGPRRDDEAEFYIKRVMPNIAADLGQSMSVMEATSMPDEYEDMADWIFLQVGKTANVAPGLFDVGGVLAGATGAFFTVAFDGILDGAVKQGLKRADAKKILTQSLFSVATLLESGEHPAELREKFSSPRGTTIEGLLSLEEDRVRHGFSKAVIASSKRSEEIGK